MTNLLTSLDELIWKQLEELDFAIITGGLGSIFLVATSYFKDQIMNPPSTKKPFWKTTYEGIKNKFKPKPQLEPTAEPASQYATIDEMLKPISPDHQS